MDKFLLRKEEKSEDDEGIVPSPAVIGEAAARRQKYRKYSASYLNFGFIPAEISGEVRPQCIICMKILAADCMRPNKLKRHLDANHPYLASKSREFF